MFHYSQKNRVAHHSWQKRDDLLYIYKKKFVVLLPYFHWGLAACWPAADRAKFIDSTRSCHAVPADLC